MRKLSNWGSARDVYEIVLPSLYTRRASRILQETVSTRIVNERVSAVGGGGGGGSPRMKIRSLPGTISVSPPPYELEDVRKTFEELIVRRRGSNISTREPLSSFEHRGNRESYRETSAPSSRLDHLAEEVASSPHEIHSVSDFADFKNLLLLRPGSRYSSNDTQLTVFIFTSSWSPSCANLMPHFTNLSRQLRSSQISFASVDFELNAEVAQHCDVTLLPTVKVYEANVEVISLPGVEDASIIQQAIRRYQLIQRQKVKNEAPFHQPLSSMANNDHDTGSGSGSGSGGSTTEAKSKAIAAVNVLVNPLVKMRREDDNDDEGFDSSLSEEELWAALEEACSELGYSLEKIEEMLESPDFPYKEVLLLVMKKVNSDNRSAVIAMLGLQRLAVLQKIKTAIAEIRRKKSEKERRVLDAVRAIGKCVAGFDWIKTEGGYRCAGGSHFVSDAEVPNVH